ncbi:MAG TPA: DUF4240 domain-containing protein [Polyangiaceae bacterium]|nr:DUF4240 domain-containing protein [Polyangiaceae bacterium]
MDTTRFWEIVAESRANFDPELADGNMDAQLERLQELLGELSPAEVLEFQRELDERMNAAYRWDLWGAAYLIEGGCSDDGFTDFRSWLISMGRDVYDAAVRDPETLVEVADADGVEATSFEEFQYVPSQVYEEKAGQEMPDTGVMHPEEPAGEQWSEEGDDLSRLFPKLWAQYGDA